MDTRLERHPSMVRSQALYYRPRGWLVDDARENRKAAAALYNRAVIAQLNVEKTTTQGRIAFIRGLI